jgi:hypothetical protein
LSNILPEPAPTEAGFALHPKGEKARTCPQREYGCDSGASLCIEQFRAEKLTRVFSNSSRVKLILRITPIAMPARRESAQIIGFDAYFA